MVLIVVFFTGKALAQFFAKYNGDRIVARYVFEQQKTIFDQTTHSSWPFLLDLRVGHLERILLFDVQNCANILANVSSTILILTSFLMYASVAISISAKITLITIAFGGISFFITKPIFYRTRKLFEGVAAMQKVIGHYVAQSIIGAKAVKIMGSEHAVVHHATAEFNRLRRSAVLGAFYNYLATAFFEPTGYLFIATLFLLSYRTPGFNIAAFGVVIYLIQKMFAFTQSLQGQLQNISGAVAYLQSTLNYQTSAILHQEVDTGTDSYRFSDSIAFDGVSFDHRERKGVLSEISFTIPRGSMLGIIGPSGSGKTTLVDLLLRLFEPTSGKITVDGSNIKKIRMSEWRHHIGYVPQDTFLLNDTIEQNIRFYDDRIDEARIQEAISSAQLSDMLRELPDGLQTVVGERGVKLSGGQRQRIALARALARTPDILDEATSNLDTASETRIQEALRGLKGRVTIVVIAHRISTILNADHIISLENGRIVHRGPAHEIIH